MTTNQLRRRTVLVVISVGIVAMGCTLRSDEKPRAIPKDAVPKALSQQNPSSTTTQPATSDTQQRVVYLVRAQGATETLVSQRVAIRTPANPQDLPRAVIERLINNPPVSDKSEFTSAIPPGTTIRSVVQKDDILYVDLRNLGSIEGTRQRLAVAQIVFTATAIEGINGVHFSIDGSPSAVPLDDRSSEIGAQITRDDFPKLRPGASAATTTTLEPDGTDPAASVGREGTEPRPPK